MVLPRMPNFPRDYVWWGDGQTVHQSQTVHAMTHPAEKATDEKP